MENQSTSYVINKQTVGSVYFMLSNITDESMTRVVCLDDTNKSIRLPRTWALGVFTVPATFEMLKKGYISFADNEAAYNDAIQSDIFIGNADDIPAKTEKVEEKQVTLLESLIACDTAVIDKTCRTQKGKREIVTLINDNQDKIPTGTVKYVEKLLNISLTISEE